VVQTAALWLGGVQRALERAPTGRGQAALVASDDDVDDAGLPRTDRELERTVLDLLAQRAADATICPSEAARAVGGEQWRELMEPVRAAARRLVVAGEVEITQGGLVVDPSTAGGPIRIRRRRR
jgi:hypothetical protein